MNIPKKYSLFVLVLILLSGPLYADDPEAVVQEGENKVTALEQTTLKERQHFNKLKRTTFNIYKVTMRSTVAFRLQTALGYVSTIDLPEKALKVFVGDQELFKVEVYESQVLIKPITDETDARTNLLIVTDSGRLAFDVSVGPPETADFVLDFRLPQDDESLVKNAFDQKINETVQKLEEVYQKKEENLDEQAEKLSQDKLKSKVASGVRTVKLKKSKIKGGIQVDLLSLSRVADKGYLRFSIVNHSGTPYEALTAMVGVLSYERKFLRKREAGMVEIPSELQLAPVVKAGGKEYGVLVFDSRTLRKNEKPVFRICEDASEPRHIEIKKFGWLK